MGAACCIAAKNKTTRDESSGASATIQRHSHYSPSWSFRWDNRGRVAGEETTVDWFDNRGRENDRTTVKSSAEATFASDDGSLLDSFRSVTWQKSPAQPLPSSDPAVSLNSAEVKGSIDSLSVAFPSPRKLSPAVPSVSSMSVSPLSFQNHLLIPANATPSRWHHCSPAPEFLRQASDSRIPEYKSPTFSISEEPSLFPSPAWANESTWGSVDSFSIPALSDLAISARRERWSFDSGTSSFSRDKITRNSGRKPGASFDLQTCGICAKLLTERSSWRWSSQKIIASNEIAVVSVLTCGHVYHGECLEYMTPEINKYDPSCPVCTFGEKMTLKMSEKALRNELECKAKRRSRKRIVDSDLKSTNMMMLDPFKSNGSTMKQSSTSGKPFLRRHFSFGSRNSRSICENQSAPRKGLFWAKSSKY